jgi:hypothetical protein
MISKIGIIKTPLQKYAIFLRFLTNFIAKQHLIHICLNINALKNELKIFYHFILFYLISYFIKIGAILRFRR